MASIGRDTDHLNGESLEWARRHLDRYGDSDMLPRPFEYEAIARGWSYLRNALEKTDLTTIESRALQTFLVPKEKAGYRVAIRLDPLDAIIYTAAVYECGIL